MLGAKKTPNESNQKQKPNYQERGDPWVSNQQVRSLRRSEKMSCLVREGTKNSRTGRLVDGPPFIQSCVPVSVKLVDEDERRRRKRRRRSNENGETRVWTIAHSARGNRQLTSECQDCHMQLWRSRKSPRSRAREEDRKSSSSRSTSSRLAAE